LHQLLDFVVVKLKTILGESMEKCIPGDIREGSELLYYWSMAERTASEEPYSCCYTAMYTPTGIFAMLQLQRQLSPGQNAHSIAWQGKRSKICSALTSTLTPQRRFYHQLTHHSPTVQPSRVIRG
jgi:hypothetical protein